MSVEDRMQGLIADINNQTVVGNLKWSEEITVYQYFNERSKETYKTKFKGKAIMIDRYGFLYVQKKFLMFFSSFEKICSHKILSDLYELLRERQDAEDEERRKEELEKRKAVAISELGY